MSTPPRWLQSLLSISVFMLLLVTILLFYQHQSRVPQTQQKQPLVMDKVSQAPDSPLPTAIIIGTIEPAPTPLPTFTPWPTATRYPGPTATPVPLPQPADSPAGMLFYAVRTQTDGYSTSGKILQLQLDANGKISAPEQEIGRGWMRSYISWDRTLVAFVERTMGGDRIYILNPATEKIIPVAESMSRFGFFLGWHPNNKDLLYLVSDSAYGGLWLLNFETGTPTIIVQQDPAYIIDGAISPDGQRIVYSQQKGITAPGELWTAFADGSENKMLISGEVATGISWSPDNSKIAYFGTQGLCVIKLDDTACKVMARNANAENLFKPLWSPDGRYIAYVAIETELASADMSGANEQNKVQDWDKDVFVGANIHLLNIETGEEKIPVPMMSSDKAAGYIDPTWSPDGKQIAFAGLQSEQANIWIVNVDGTDLHAVAEAATLIRFPIWTK